jgi:hypothetical protein
MSAAGSVVRMRDVARIELGTQTYNVMQEKRVSGSAGANDSFVRLLGGRMQEEVSVEMT